LEIISIFLLHPPISSWEMFELSIKIIIFT
jgi:hypothetical protein